MSESLKPCPFCGNSPTVFENEGRFNIFCEADDFQVAAGYKATPCPIEPASGILFDSLDDAIHAWNERPIEDDLSKLNAVLLARAEKAEAENKHLLACALEIFSTADGHYPQNEMVLWSDGEGTYIGGYNAEFGWFAQGDEAAVIGSNQPDVVFWCTQPDLQKLYQGRAK